MESQGKRKDIIFFSVLILVHAAFYIMALCFKKLYMGDSFEYIYEAINIKNSGFFYSGNPVLPIQEEYMTQRQPLYPFFLLLVYIFTINNWIVLILQNMLSIFNIWYLRKMLLRFGFSKQYDWLLLLLLIVYPAQFINANTIAPDILLQTFTLAYFAQFVLWIQTKLPRHSIYASLALIAGLFVKPVLYPFAFVHGLILLIVAIKQRKGILLWSAALPVCAIMLYNYSNYQRTGKFHFSSNQAFNAIFFYNRFYKDTRNVASADTFLKSERKKMAAIPNYKDRYDYANARGIELLKQNTVPYVTYHLKHSIRFFIDPGKGELDLFTGKLTYTRLYARKEGGFYSAIKTDGFTGLMNYIKENSSLLIVVVVLLFNCIKMLGVAMFVCNKRINVYIRLFTCLLFIYFAAVTGPIANTRYFLPISLIASGFAVISYQYLLQRRRNKAIITTS